MLAFDSSLLRGGGRLRSALAFLPWSVFHAAGGLEKRQSPYTHTETRAAQRRAMGLFFKGKSSGNAFSLPCLPPAEAPRRNLTESAGGSR